jgi:hypothetical protein
VLSLALNYSSVFAFEDIYEDNDTFGNATLIKIGDTKRCQYTLHNRDDEDWFKFYAPRHGNDGKEIRYEIKIYNTGYDIDVAFELYEPDAVTLIRRVNKLFTGNGEHISSWIPPSDGYYYIKVYDTALESDSCRKDIQYEILILVPVACL